jgi:hypothetical protein
MPELILLSDQDAAPLDASSRGAASNWTFYIEQEMNNLKIFGNLNNPLAHYAAHHTVQALNFLGTRSTRAIRPGTGKIAFTQNDLPLAAKTPQHAAY